MIERLAQRDGAVYLLLAAYFFVNLVGRVAMPGNLEFDEGQQLFFSQWIAIGYDSQPPLYNWLQYAVVQVVGSNVLALALLKNLMLFLSYLLFGLAAHVVIRNRVLAIVATLALITFPHIGYEAQRDLSHTVALLFTCCLFACFFFRALCEPTAANYALTGLAIGLGVLSKYNFVLLPLAAAVALLWDVRWRSRLFDVRVLLMIAVSAVVVLPHAIWFVGHVDAATGETLGKLNPGAQSGYAANVGKGLLSLGEAVATLLLPTLAVYAVAFRGALFRAWTAQSEWTAFLGRLFLISAVLLVGFVLLGQSTEIKTRWVMPFFFLLPIYLSAKLEASDEAYDGAQSRFGAIVLAIMVIIPLLIFSRPFMGLLGDYNKHNVPMREGISAILKSNPDRPSVVLAGDQQLAGNFRMHAPDLPVMGLGYEAFQRPFVFDATHPVLVVWREGDGLPVTEPSKAVRTWLTRYAPGYAGGEFDVRDVALPYQLGHNGDVYHFGYAWVYPASGS